MKQRVMTVLMTAILLAALAGCGQQEELRETQRQLEQTQQQLEQLQQQLDETTAQQPSSEPSASQGEQTTQQPEESAQQPTQQEQATAQQPASEPSVSEGEQTAQQPEESAQQPTQQEQAGTDRDGALAIALENAGVDEQDIYNVKVEQDGDNGIPIYDIEFETDYGDYDFEVAIADGRIVGADYEVDEEWLDTLGGSPVDQDGVRQLVAAKVPGASAQDVQVWEEGGNSRGDGRGRYEGELYHDSMKYEFEVDPRTGRIFDWVADWRG